MDGYYNTTSTGVDLLSIAALIVALILIVFLLYVEYIAHDCKPGKVCTHSVPAPSPDDDDITRIKKIKEMVRNNYMFVSWRMSLLVALIVTLVIVYFFKGRIPTLGEWIVITGIVFLGSYFSSSWLWSHFFYPNSEAIESSLQKLSDNIATEQNNTV